VDWDEQLFSLFDDLEQQAESLYDLEREGDLADRSRSEYAAVSLASRLMASVGDRVGLSVRAVGDIGGELRRVGDGWCLVHGPAQDWVVRLAAVVTVEGTSGRSLPEAAWSPLTRLGFGSTLRRIADTGDRCLVHTLDGATRDVVLSRVGQDFVEATMGEGRTILIAHVAIAAVQSRA
jgi:hypothetical protein